jgi:alkylation response protein AidB-like acyl-CoA dehydrogenase
MSWLGPALDADQRGLLEMLDALIADRDADLTDDPAQVRMLRKELGELGVWTLGAAQEHGGGGADCTMTTVALERLGRRWPALGLASAHAHAAADVLGPAGCDGLVARLHIADAVVAVVDASAEHVALTRRGDALTGHVDRVDVGGAPDALIVLAGEDTALLVDTPALTAGPVLRRTGLGGACTAPLTVNGTIGRSVHEVDGVDGIGVRARLWLGAAAVAAGIAGAAAAGATVYAAGRQQFGGPISELPTVRRSLFVQTCRAAVALGAVVGADPRSAAAACAALTGACDAAVDVAAASLQIHGGYGYLTEYPAERYVRDAVSLRAAVDATGATHIAATSIDQRKVPIMASRTSRSVTDGAPTAGHRL